MPSYLSFGRVRSPSPSARCMRTLSTQRPNFSPVDGSRPARTKPQRSCNLIKTCENEAATLVQFDRALVGAVAYDRDHLPEPGARAGGDQHREQRGPDAVADMIAVHVDRILDR